MAERHGSASLAATLYFCSFVSGIAALGYEVVWTKSLSLPFGATRLAAGAVLAAFLGGMGLGARAYPLLLSRLRRPLRAYALLEVGIAATSLPVTLLLPRLTTLFAPVADAAGSGAELVMWRFAFAFVVLLVPCALMGATFPALSVVLIRSRGSLSRHLGLLYGINTLGAALGVLLAGVVSVEALGLRGTVIAGNVLNLLVATVVLRRAQREPHEADAPIPSEPAPSSTTLPAALTGAVLVVSGFATLAYEIVWFRALAYLFGNSTYAFTTMLFVFLIGLGVGPLLFRAVVKRHNTELALALCQLGIAVTAMIAIAAIAAGVGSDLFQQRVSIFFQTFYDRPWQERLLVDSAVAFVTMFPATLLMGLSFPLATSLFVGDVRRLGERLGDAVLLANLGSIAGALAGAIVILPAFGTVGGTRAIAAVNGVLALAILARAPGSFPRRIGIAAAGVCALVLGAGLGPDHIHFVVAGAAADSADLVYEKEGDLATVQVWRDHDHPECLGMAIDGTTIGATRGWGATLWPKQVLIAHLPFALDDRLRDILTVGLGSGETLEAILSHPSVRSADVVEINAPVVAGCRFFPAASALDDPRVTVVVDDALHFLQRTPRRYDAVISDGKQAMSFAGTAKLLTSEYYRLCRDHLTDHGLFVQWVPLAIGHEEYGMIVRTLADVFDQVEVFFEPPSHIIFVASTSPVVGRPSPPAAGVGDVSARDLAELGIPSPGALLARWVADGASIAATVGPGPTNTWDRPRLEFTAYRLSPARWGAETSAILTSMERAAEAAGGTPQAVAYGSGSTARAIRTLRTALAAHAAGDVARARALALRALATAPEDPVVRVWAERLAGPAALARS